jgi:hypothetical protein
MIADTCPERRKAISLSFDGALDEVEKILLRVDNPMLTLGVETG